MPEPLDVDQHILALEAPLRALKPLGRRTVEEILNECMEDVFAPEDDDD